MNKYFCSVLVLFFTAHFLQAQQSNTYYVAKTGSLSGVGSITDPFLSISQASEIMIPGDTCYIQVGIYREVLDPANDGTAAAPIVFKAYENDKVVISATQAIKEWTIHEGKIYKADVDMTLGRQNMIYLNGEITDRARWPNNVDHDPYTVEAVKITAGTNDEMTLENLPALEDWSNALVWYLGGHSGTSWTRPVTGGRGKRINFEPVNAEKWPFTPHHPTIVRHGNRGQCFLFGKLDLLDYPREWYYDEQEKRAYLQLPENFDFGRDTIEYAVRERTIFLNKNYIVVDGINTFGGKVHLKGDHCIIRNGQFSNGLQILDELDNTDAQIGNASVHVQSSNNLIENNIIEYGSVNGIFIQGWGGVSNNTVRGNIIRYFNTVGTHSSPIRSPSVGTKIIGNTIYGTGRDGIYAPAKDCEIAYNDVSQCMLINNDGGIFYVVGNDENKNTSIHHNWFHDTYGPDYADGRSAGIYLDNRSKGYDVHHNVVWNIDWSAVQMNWDAWNNDIFNNTFWHTGQAMGIWLNGYIQRDNRVWNNFSDVGDWEGQDLSANIISTVNPFMDSEEHDFRPGNNSSLIDMGVVIEGITDGYQGSAPDVGAYENGGDFWIPGVERFGVITSTQLQPGEVQPLEVKFFPNPLRDTGYLLIDLPIPSSVHWRLHSIDGKVIQQQTLRQIPAGQHQLQIDMNNLLNGTYFITGKTEIGFFSQRLIIE